MKKYLIIKYLIILCLIIVGINNCLLAQEERWPTRRGTQDYIVEKIDSLYNYYFIYVSRNNRINTYRLVERKYNDSLCEQHIVIGKIYSLTIHGMEDNIVGDAGYVGDLDSSVEIEEGVVIPIEPEWGFDIYYADEIVGLCYKRKNKIQ